MNTVVIAIFVAIFAAAAVLLVSNLSAKGRRQKKAEKALSNASTQGADDTRWRAVRIEPGLMSCETAAGYADQVFLAREAPRLPLAECTEQECRCKYIHLEDRRSGGDRRIELGELGAFLPTNRDERRQSKGRRAADLET